MFINSFCHFWISHYDIKNWQLTTLWGLFVALKVYNFLKQIIQTWNEPKLEKIKMIFLIKDRFENAKQFVRHLILGVLLKISKSVGINNHINEIFLFS